MNGWKQEPFVIDVKAGETKAFCMCGLSKNGPFCDGSHAGSDKTPHVEAFSEDRTLYVCGCRQSGNTPYCDGSHQEL